MISFLSPLFLAGALAAGVPILLHLLKRHPEARVKFSAVRLLRNAPVENTHRRHLRELLLLALRVAALLLLALAFARPFFSSGAAAASSTLTVIALDVSASMSAPGQLERAKALARAAVDRAGAGDRIGLVAFSDVAQVLAEPSADHASVSAAIDGAPPGFGATSFRAGLNAASDLLDRRAGTVVVVTDLQETGWDSGDRATVSDTTQIQIADVGPPPPNLAVTAARVSGDRVIATVRNTAAQARDAHVRALVNTGNGEERTAGEATTPIGPNQSADVSFQISGGRWAAVRVDDRQGMDVDNSRFVVLDGAGRSSVLVVTATGDLGREAFYVQHALAAAGGSGSTYAIEGVSGEALSSWDQARVDAHTAIVVLSTRSLERRGREVIGEYVRRGGGVLVAAGPDIDGDVLPEILAGVKAGLVALSTADEPKGASRSLAPADVRHPVFRAFGAGAPSLGLVKFDKVRTIRAAECHTLARFTTGEAALVECAPGEGRALLLASDLDNRGNDFPRHPTFVPFLHEAVRYLAGARRAAADYLVGSVPAGVSRAPGVQFVPLSAGTAPQLISVNVDPKESDPARLTAEEFQTAVTRLKDVATTEQRIEIRQQEDRQHIWQYVLMLMIAMLLVESFVAAKVA